MTVTNSQPGLFGLTYCNRDFALPESWGKNQFNNAFPVALLCYMGVQNINPVYLSLNSQLKIDHGFITSDQLLGLSPLNESLFFSFEEAFTPYADLVVGQLPRADLVTRDRQTANKDCLHVYEVKLTALPDNSTCEFRDESLYGCEIVVRPDTITYIALAIAKLYAANNESLKHLINPICTKISGWEDAQNIRPYMLDFVNLLDEILLANITQQTPLLLQPVWKTKGKKSILADHCFDMFVWSDFAITRLYVDQAKNRAGSFTRPERALVWLIKMLDDFANRGRMNPGQVTSLLSYNTRNDKAFAVNGRITHSYMACQQLTKPRIPKTAVKDIILGGGQNYLSPERRLDAIIVNSPKLFE